MDKPCWVLEYSGFGCNPSEQAVFRKSSRKSVRPGVVSLFLQVGRSSGFRLLREVKSGEPHISGQDVKLVFCHRRYLPYGILKLVSKLLYFPLHLNSVFEMYLWLVKLYCKLIWRLLFNSGCKLSLKTLVACNHLCSSFGESSCAIDPG